MEEQVSILKYHYCADEENFYNPYLREVMNLASRMRDCDCVDDYSGFLAHRGELVSKYAFSIPTLGVLRKIAPLSPLVEIGAGSGYWAMCLASLGADILAFDARVPGENHPWDWRGGNAWHEDTWFAVEEGDAYTAGLYPERTLFLCWPPPENAMAIVAAQAHRESGGKKLVFLGSEFSCAEMRFFEFLRRCREILRLPVPSWPGICEVLRIVEYK